MNFSDLVRASIIFWVLIGVGLLMPKAVPEIVDLELESQITPMDGEP